MEDVEAATRDDVEAFFRRFYVPSNASLAIVGDVDEAEAIDLAARYFGDLPGGTKAIRPWTPALDASRWNGTIVYRDRVELDRLYLAWPTVAQFEADDAPLAVLSDVLTRGKSGRLYQRLVVDEGLAQDVATHQSGRELAGSFAATVTLRPGKSWERARELVDAEIAAIARDGVTAEELERVQNGRLAGFIYALDNVGGFGGVADRLNAYNTFLGDPGRIVTDLERFRAVTVEAVADVARRYLSGRPRVELAVVRKPTVSAHLDRTTPPDPGPSVAFRAPRPEERRLSCGVPLWVIPRRDLPIVAMTCVVKAGAGVHGPDRGGLASLTADLHGRGDAHPDVSPDRPDCRRPRHASLGERRVGRFVRRHAVPDAAPRRQPRSGRRRSPERGLPARGFRPGEGSNPRRPEGPARAGRGPGLEGPDLGALSRRPSLSRAQRRDRGDRLGAVSRRSPAVPFVPVCPGTVGDRRGGRRRPGRPGAAARFPSVRLVDERRGRCVEARRGPAPQAPDDSPRSPGRGAGGGAGRARRHRPARCRLLGPDALQPDPRRPVHLAAQREAA